MLVVTATMVPESERGESWFPFNWPGVAPYIIDNSHNNVGVVQSYQEAYMDNPDGKLIAYVHDDVEIKEGRWMDRVQAEFDNDPSVGLVGFGGAKQHGDPLMYKTPCVLQQLARGDYLSNVDDADVHGQRFTDATDVAVLDGFALVVRRNVLDHAWLRTDPSFRGGWPTEHLRFHCYDYYLCCMARRLGYRIRMVGVRCHHHGGRTSTTKEYQEWLAAKGTTDVKDHEESHQWIYEEFKDVLPFRVS